jgi:hypothetical protein
MRDGSTLRIDQLLRLSIVLFEHINNLIPLAFGVSLPIQPRANAVYYTH